MKKKKTGRIYAGIIGVGLAVIILFFFVTKTFRNNNSYPETQITSGLIQSPSKRYINDEIGITFTYPSEIAVIFEDNDTDDWYVLLTNDSNLLSKTVPGMNFPENESSSISIQVNVHNGTSYEVPWSGGNTVTIDENNLSLYHLVEPSTSVKKGVLRGRPTLSSFNQDMKKGHFLLTVLDTNRLLQMKIDTDNADVFPFEVLDGIVSSFQFI